MNSIFGPFTCGARKAKSLIRRDDRAIGRRIFHYFNGARTVAKDAEPDEFMRQVGESHEESVLMPMAGALQANPHENFFVCGESHEDCG
jgi:hypothetical protein